MLDRPSILCRRRRFPIVSTASRRLQALFTCVCSQGPASEFTIYDGTKIEQELSDKDLTVSLSEGDVFTNGYVIEILGVEEDPNSVEIDGAQAMSWTRTSSAPFVLEVGAPEVAKEVLSNFLSEKSLLRCNTPACETTTGFPSWSISIGKRQRSSLRSFRPSCHKPHSIGRLFHR